MMMNPDIWKKFSADQAECMSVRMNQNPVNLSRYNMNHVLKLEPDIEVWVSVCVAPGSVDHWLVWFVYHLTNPILPGFGAIQRKWTQNLSLNFSPLLTVSCTQPVCGAVRVGLSVFRTVCLCDWFYHIFDQKKRGGILNSIVQGWIQGDSETPLFQKTPH